MSVQCQLRGRNSYGLSINCCCTILRGFWGLNCCSAVFCRLINIQFQEGWHNIVCGLTTWHNQKILLYKLHNNMAIRFSSNDKIRNFCALSLVLIMNTRTKQMFNHRKEQVFLLALHDNGWVLLLQV